MKCKVVKLENNKSVLVDGTKSAEIREGDRFEFDGKIRLCERNDINGIRCIESIPLKFHNPIHCFKLTATINHSISLDVPMVVVESEVEIITETLCTKKGNENNTIDLNAYALGIIDCYKVAQEKGVYSLDDVHKAIDLARKEPKIMIGDITQSLKQEYVELKWETYYFSESGNDQTRIETDRNSNGQLIAYIKE